MNKKGISLSVVLVLLLTLLSGCYSPVTLIWRAMEGREPGSAVSSAAPSQPSYTYYTGTGTRDNPLGADDWAVYDGMHLEGRDAFAMDITLSDAVRGEEALEIFLKADSYNKASDIPEGKELIILRLEVYILEALDSTPVLLGEDDITMFRLVSGEGITYDLFYTRRYIPDDQGTLFSNLYEGASQTGHLFFLVDEDDPEPLVVFQSHVDGGIWMKTNIPPSEKGYDTISLADWGEDRGPIEHNIQTSRPEGSFAGTLSDPLPWGEMGLFIGDYHVVEMEVIDVIRGDEVLRTLDTDGYNNYPSRSSGQELMRIEMKLNYLEGADDAALNLSTYMFDFVKENGQAVEFYETVYPTPVTALRTMYPGSTQTGYLYLAVDKDEPVYRFSLSDGLERLWFTTDKTVKLGSQYDSYTSSFQALTVPVYDTTAPLGSRLNPPDVGETVSWHLSGYHATADIEMEVQEIIRGSRAEALSETEYGSRETLDGYDLVLAKLKVHVLNSVDDDPVPFIAYNFHAVGGDGLMCGETIYGSTVYKFSDEGGLGNVYAGDDVTGWIAIFVLEGEEYPLLQFPYYGADEPVWLKLYE